MAKKSSPGVPKESKEEYFQVNFPNKSENLVGSGPTIVRDRDDDLLSPDGEVFDSPLGLC